MAQFELREEAMIPCNDVDLTGVDTWIGSLPVEGEAKRELVIAYITNLIVLRFVSFWEYVRFIGDL